MLSSLSPAVFVISAEKLYMVTASLVLRVTVALPGSRLLGVICDVWSGLHNVIIRLKHST